MGFLSSLKKNTSQKGGNSFEFLVVGLGNPGIKYENTRHNAGFLAIDKIAKEHGSILNKSKFKSIYGECSINGTKVLLVKPLTYMNNSGETVAEMIRFYKISIDNVIVLYDDVFLDVGKIRIRRKGSDGGHNGIKSIIQLTGSDAFPRVKIGVGKKPHPEYDLADWVLSNFKKDEDPQMNDAYEKTLRSVELIVEDKINEAMNLYTS